MTEVKQHYNRETEDAIRYKLIEERREKNRKLANSVIYGVLLFAALLNLLAGIHESIAAAFFIFLGEGIVVTLLVDWGVITVNGERVGRND
jgi:hypothetical protein